MVKSLPSGKEFIVPDNRLTVLTGSAEPILPAPASVAPRPRRCR